MNFRFTAILFLVLLLLVGGLLIATLVDDKPSSDAQLFADLAGLKADADIEVVEIVRDDPNEEKLVMAKVGKDRWEFRDTTSGRLDASTVLHVIDAILKLKPTPSTELTGNPQLHGLDKPSLKVTLRAKNQRTATLLVGDTTLGGERAVTFVATGDRPSVPLAVKRSDLAPLFRDGAKDGKASQLAKWASEYRLKRLLGVEIFDVVNQAKALKIKVGGKEMALSRGTGSEWKFDVPPGYGLVDLAGDPAPRPDVITGLRALAGMLPSLSPLDASDFIENPEPDEKYGLAANDPNLIRIELVPAAGDPEVLLIGKAVEGDKSGKHYAKVPGEKCVGKIFGEPIASLVKTVNDPRVLQDRTLVRDLDVPRIDAVDVTVAGTTTKLRKVYVGSLVRWVLYGGPTDPQTAGPAIQTLLTELAKPRLATEVLAAPNDALFAGPELKAEVKLWIEGFDEKGDPKSEAMPAEPKLKGWPTMTLLIGKTEGESTYVRRTLADGSKTDFKVPAAAAALAVKKRVEFFDLKLKEFATNLATKLSFNRGAEVFELERSPTPDMEFPTGKWIFAKPDSLKGQIVDTEKIVGPQPGAGLLGILSTLSASSVAAEAPTDAELKAMGLDPAAPRLKVTVALNGEKDKERVFLFGNETADKGNVYFKLPGKAIVYLVPRVTIDAFLTADLRDRTPFRFDVKDVKRVQLRWRKAGAITDLALERSGETWTAKATPSWTATPQSMARLLNFFHAPRPIAVLGPVKPEYGLDLNKDDDAMEVKFFTDKAEFTVTLGKLADSGFYALASPMSEAITLNKGLYEQFKPGPEYFKK